MSVLVAVLVAVVVEVSIISSSVVVAIVVPETFPSIITGAITGSGSLDLKLIKIPKSTNIIRVAMDTKPFIRPNILLSYSVAIGTFPHLSLD